MALPPVEGGGRTPTRTTPTTETATKPGPSSPARVDEPRGGGASDARSGTRQLGERSSTRPSDDGPTGSRPVKARVSRPSSESRPGENYVDRAVRTGEKLAVSHKGTGGRNVTTIDGMRAKADAGIDPIEVKTSRTKDGVVVAYPGPRLTEHHDDEDAPLVSDLTFRELRDDPDWAHVPTLAEVAREAEALDVDIAVSFDADQPDEDRDAVLAVLDRELPKDRARIFSRDPETQAELRATDRERTIDPLPVDPATTPGETPHENSIDAIRKSALDGSTDAVEIDFTRLGDGTIVAYHDPTVDGLHLGTLDWEEFHARYPDAPRLSEVGEALAEHPHLDIMADIKGTGLEVGVIEGLLEHVPSERISAFSFDRDVVRTLNERYDDIPIGYLPLQYDDGNLAERLRQRAAGTARQQIEQLGFVPDFIEVSGNNVNTDVLDWAGDHGVTVLAGGGSTETKVALGHDDRVLGYMEGDTSPVDSYVEADYDPDRHAVPEPTDQNTVDNPVLRLLFNEGYEFVANNEYGQRATNLAVQGGGTAWSGLQLLNPMLRGDERDAQEGEFAADALNFLDTQAHETRETLDDVGGAIEDGYDAVKGDGVPFVPGL